MAAAAEAPERAIAPSDPGRRVSYAYAAPERGYPDRPCRVCGQRPCAVRLGWCAGWGRSRASGYAHFCAAHTAEANRACRALKAGLVPPDRPAPPRSVARPPTRIAADAGGPVRPPRRG